MFLTSPLLSDIPRVLHGFGTAEEPIPAPFRDLWKQRANWKQVHGTRIIEVKSPLQVCGEADGFYTTTPGLPVAATTADCVPILLAQREGKRVAAVHAGWRGTRARILRHLWDELLKKGEKPEEWFATLGPAIGPCCFEVSSALADEFRSEFSSFGEEMIVPSDRHVDLLWINQQELKAIGLREVEIIRICTCCCTMPLFSSYRRQGGGNRQYSVISMDTND